MVTPVREGGRAAARVVAARSVSRARERDATAGPEQVRYRRRPVGVPTRRFESSPYQYRRRVRLPEGAGSTGSCASRCGQRPRRPPVKAARSPKTRPRVRSAPTLEPSNDERLPPSALANSSPQNPIAHRERRATTKRWPSSQQLEPRAPRPSRGAVACRPVHLMSCSRPAVPSANNPFGHH